MTYRNDGQQLRRPPDVYLYTSVPHFDKQREVTGVVHIGVGFLRCSLQVVGIAKALNTERTKMRFPRLFYIFLSTLDEFVRPTGVWGDTHKQNRHMIHAGQLIERTLHEQGRTVTWFATQLCCTRPNVYKIFRKENIDIHLLWRISYILGHDFFRDLSDSINTGSFPSVSK